MSTKGWAIHLRTVANQGGAFDLGAFEFNPCVFCDGFESESGN